MSRVGKGTRCSGLLLLVLTLAACGGGGGGGGGGYSGGGTTGTISIATRSLTFHADGISATTPAPQTISATVTGVTAGTLYLVVRVTGPAVATVSNFTITGTTSGQAQVFPQGQMQLGAGSFSSTITVTACTTDPSCSSTQLNGSPITIDVTYTIDGLNSSAKSLGYQVGNAPTSSDLTGTFNITGYPVQNFAAVSDAPWLSVTPTSASTSASTAVTGNLVPAELDKLDSGVYTANVTMTPTSGDPVVVPVTLTVTRTQVNYASPYADLSGAQGDVIIRGENFNLVHPTSVQFGSTAASAFTVVSDTEIHATHPPLLAGAYSVHVLNTEGVDRTRAQLVVTDAQAHAATTLAYPAVTANSPLDMVYDAGRGALLVARGNPNLAANGTELDRYTYAAGTGWSSAATTSLPGIGAMALTADGGKLLVGTQDAVNAFDSYINELDPTTLVTLLTTHAQSFGPPGHIAVVNDGRAIITGGLVGIQPIMSYSELRPQIVPLVPNPNGPSASVYNGVVAASGDGSIATITDALGGIMQWNASTEQLSPAQSANHLYWVNLSRDGARTLVGINGGGIQVYDAALNLIGTLPSGTLMGVLAPSGQRAYTFDVNGTVRMFDVSTPGSAQTQFPEILPAITPLASPSVNLGNPLKMVISPDGGTLFIAGDQQVIVQPLP